MIDEPSYDYTAAMKRILSVTGCRTQQELAAFFGVRQSSISDAGRRRSIPSGWLLTLLREKGVNPEWIIGGRCAPYLLPGMERAEVPKSSAEVSKSSADNWGCSLKTFSTEQLVEEILNRVKENVAL